jgi:hypothetical protein
MLVTQTRSPTGWLSACKPEPDHKGINPQPIADEVPSEWLVTCTRSIEFRSGSMNTQGQDKCAYSRCKCIVGTRQKYCSDYCADADDVQETEIQCDCKHAPCALG